MLKGLPKQFVDTKDDEEAEATKKLQLEQPLIKFDVLKATITDLPVLNLAATATGMYSEQTLVGGAPWSTMKATAMLDDYQ